MIDKVPEGERSLEVVGVLQFTEQRHGFLRSPKQDYRPEQDDPIVPRSLITELGLEQGVELSGMAVPAEQPGRAPCLAEIRSINGLDHEAWSERTPFKNLVAEDPSERNRTRPVLTGEKIDENAKTYFDQVGKIVDLDRAEVRRNGEWFEGMKTGRTG